MKMVKVVSKCRKCKKIDTFEVPASGLKARSKGMKVDQAFPILSQERRSQLTTQVCPNCQTPKKS